MRYARATLMSTAMALSWPLPALSQSVPPTGPAETQASDTSGTVGLEDIVVTAQRRSENAQHAAISVTTVSADQLAKASITTAADLTVAVPALQASNQSAFTAFFIRGIGSFAYNAYAEPAVAFNLNGVYISRLNAVNGQFYDLERVEVLKGPQGTLYGRNATGGAINVIARRPDLGKFNGYVSAQYGNYDELLTTGAINVPLGENGGLRAAFQTEDHDGYMRDGTDDAKNRSFRISMRSQLTPDIGVNIVGDYTKIGGKGGGAVLLPFGTGGAPVRGGLGSPEVTAFYNASILNTIIFPGAITPLPQYLAHMDVKTGGVMAEVTAKTPIGTLTVLPAYRELSTDDFTTTTAFWVWDRTKQHQTSLEARLASYDDKPLRYLVGGYYFNEKANFNVIGDAQFNGPAHTPGNLSTETAAAFSQLTYAFTPALRLTGGARYSWEHKIFEAVSGSGAPVVLTGGLNLNPLVLTPPVIVVSTNTARTFRSTTWKVGVEFDIRPRSLLYANVGTGFKAGGFFLSSTRNSYDPEKVTSYVIGSKNRFFSNALQINAEAYLLKYRNQQLAHLGSIDTDVGPRPGFPTENVGRSTIYGAEVEAQYLLTETTRFSLQANYVHARYDSFVYQSPDLSVLIGAPAGAIPASTTCPTTLSGGSYTIDCSHYKMYQVPTWTLSGSIQKTFELENGGSVVAEIRSRYESGRWLSESFLPETYSGGNTLTSVNLTYNAPNNRWSVTGYVNNIENKDVVSNAILADTHPFFPAVAGTLRPPRTYGVRAQVNF